MFKKKTTWRCSSGGYNHGDFKPHKLRHKPNLYNYGFIVLYVYIYIYT